ncbi:U6 snRNA-associated Sm-like protein LSm4 isoform X1 [Aptenodytes patagonicus]|uniref:U6 snRNA-associated Sm-like protein LSm4 isoform X1 n=1 Tax=Aptenodytes patagonicus TaxID=9234 RepID=UPI003F9FEA1D
MARNGGGRAAPAPGRRLFTPGEAGTRKRGEPGSIPSCIPSQGAAKQIQGRDGDKFWRMPECYIRGSTIKYLRIPDEIIDMVKEEVVSKGRGRGGMQQQKQQKGRGVGGAGRGVFGGRGRGIPGSGRGQQEKKPGRQSAKQ